MKLIIYRNTILLLGLVISFCECLQNPCQLGAKDATANVGDFNGDGRSDVFCLDGPGNVYVLLSTSNGLKSPNSDSSGLVTNTWCSAPNVFEIRDFNGDGKADILCKTSSSHAILVSNGNSFVAPSGYTFPSSFCTGGTLYWEDFNGDGTLDLFCINKGQQMFSVLISNSLLALTSPNTNSNGNILSGWCYESGQNVYIGDFNNDNKVDILCQVENKNYFYAKVSDGSRFLSPNSDPNGYMGTFCNSQTDNVYLKDYDEDGKADLICQNKVTGYINVAPLTGTSIKSSTTFISCYFLLGTGYLQIFDPKSITRQDVLCNDVVSSKTTYFSYEPNNAVSQQPSLCDQYLYGDFNGNSLKDMFCYNRTAPSRLYFYLLKPLTSSNFISSDYPVKSSIIPCEIFSSDATPYAADFNGDGRSDLFCLDGLGNVYVLISTAGGLKSPNYVRNVLILSRWCQASNIFEIRDFNGDGKADILCKTSSSHTILLSNGGYFIAPPSYTFPSSFCTDGTLYWEDFNGDGTLDLFCMNKGAKILSVLISNSLLALSSPNTNSNVLYGWCIGSNQNVYFGDFNNDKKVDILCFSENNVYVLVSDGSRFVSPNSDTYGDMGAFCNSLDKVFFKDFNADGKADLICQNRENFYIKVALSTGTSFMSLTAVSK